MEEIQNKEIQNKTENKRIQNDLAPREDFM